MTYTNNTPVQQPRPSSTALFNSHVDARREIEARRAPALAALRQQWNGGTWEQVSLASPPDWVQKRTTTGAKARGYAFEKKVGKLLTKLCEEFGWKLWDHQWFTYTYNGETKYFQPDFIIERPGEDGVVIEVKLTYVDTNMQLNKYLKYLSVFGITCFPVTIVRNLTPSANKVIDDFSKISPNSVLHLWI